MMKTLLHRLSRIVRILFLAVVGAAITGGCAMQPPQAWEKGNLARSEMTMASDPLDQAFMQHVYFSKESASGGYGVGGGGCGCN
jgi:Domain of unknown function (DUF4266)